MGNQKAFLVFTSLLLLIFSCGKEDAVTPEPEPTCYNCTTIYIEQADPPRPIGIRR